MDIPEYVPRGIYVMLMTQYMRPTDALAFACTHKRASCILNARQRLEYVLWMDAERAFYKDDENEYRSKPRWHFKKKRMPSLCAMAELDPSTSICDACHAMLWDGEHCNEEPCPKASIYSDKYDQSERRIRHKLDKCARDYNSAMEQMECLVCASGTGCGGLLRNYWEHHTGSLGIACGSEDCDNMVTSMGKELPLPQGCFECVIVCPKCVLVECVGCEKLYRTRDGHTCAKASQRWKLFLFTTKKRQFVDHLDKTLGYYEVRDPKHSHTKQRRRGVEKAKAPTILCQKIYYYLDRLQIRDELNVTAMGRDPVLFHLVPDPDTYFPNGDLPPPPSGGSGFVCVCSAEPSHNACLMHWLPDKEEWCDHRKRK